jgi:hypothetical protein
MNKTDHYHYHSKAGTNPRTPGHPGSPHSRTNSTNAGNSTNFSHTRGLSGVGTGKCDITVGGYGEPSGFGLGTGKKIRRRKTGSKDGGSLGARLGEKGGYLLSGGDGVGRK